MTTSDKPQPKIPKIPKSTLDAAAKMIVSGCRLVVRTDGTIEALPADAKGNIQRCNEIVSPDGDGLDTVTLRHLGPIPRMVMLVDDRGALKASDGVIEANIVASHLYWLNSIAPREHMIWGPVIVCPDDDFETDDDFV